MEMHIEWNRFMRLKKDARLDYTIELKKLPKQPGIYIFGRRWSKSFEALYVGKALNIRRRVKGQLNNHKLMQHLKLAKEGRRVILTGTFKAKPGQNKEKCLKIIERGLIRYFLLLGDDLVNVQGISIRHHEITSSGKLPKRIIPGSIFVDRK